ncbi:MAG: Non-motile and phage-resistance protein [Alphaproteobacteria bacterium ADurb.BinA280]|jgi:signal transduction histidine kinase|nr:HAMP domain-containing histidine kinase [Xanthomonadales bacterium]OPZ12415.1 MAG: Non-motile and phage-resistance protein [Alphaproteobacteria bacterium ADurb.BinA280]
MRRQWSIRARVAITIGVLGLALGSTFSYTLMQIAERYEHVILRTVLAAEADSAKEDIADGRVPRMPHTAHLEGWLVPDMASAKLPEALRGLRPGIHEYRVGNGEEPHVGVFAAPNGMLVYRIDIGQIEELEEALQFWLWMLVLLSAGVTTAIGWWLAGRAVGPVDALAKAVATLPLEPAPTALAANLPSDGLGRLAGAIDHYQLRLAEAATAQKIFFANASHELRTPITALRGAVEVLLDDPSVSVPQRRRLQRLERSVTHLHWLLDALIWIARGPGEAESLSFKSQVEAAVDRLAPRLSHRGVVLDITCGDGELVAAPRRWLETMLLNLLRAVVDQRPPGPLPLHCSEGSLRLGDEVQHWMPSRSDQGIGITMVERMAAVLGWRVRCGLDVRQLFSVELDTRSKPAEWS